MSPDPDAVAQMREILVERQQIHEGRLISVFDDEVSLSDGSRAHREVVVHPGAVAIIAFDEDGRVAMVRQWRHPVGRSLWELPAGTRDRGESPERTAERELAEETGLVAQNWLPFGQWPLAPGYSTEVMHFFKAWDLEPGEAVADEDERLEVRFFSPPEVAALVRSGDVDVKTIAGLGLAGWVFTDG